MIKKTLGLTDRDIERIKKTVKTHYDKIDDYDPVL